jgi:thiamine kinase-like enzyme
VGGAPAEERPVALGAEAPGQPSLIRSLDELDAAWLAAALGTGAIEALQVRAIGTGQMSESHRISLDYSAAADAGPKTIVLKLAAADQTSRSTGVSLGIYEREVRFYRELAPRVGGPLAHCALALYDERDGFFTLLLEDVAPARQGDQIAGCSVAEARLAMQGLAQLHGPVLEDRALAASGWLNRPAPVNQALVAQLLPGFLERYGERVAAEHRALCERFVSHLDAWLEDRRGPEGLVHGDYRLDNLLFGEPGSPRALTVVDWQTVGWGGAMADAAYFLGGGLALEERRAHERELLAGYLDSLAEAGAEVPDRERCWEQYRRHALGGVLMAILASMIVERTERGDEMFVTMLARHAQHALDLDAEKLIDADNRAGAAAPPPRPSAHDERRHAAGAEQLWGESWYFDAIAPDGTLGAWVRVGLYPNLDACWYTALVCGPGRPTVAAVDFAAPLPEAGGLRVRTDALDAEHRCVDELQRFDLTLQARGEAFADAAALLHGGRGDPVALGVDLRWETAGVPYAYRMTTRYEIPCTVAGELNVGGEALKLEQAPGQRDHSWGPRDWWAMDWMWSAGRLEDGTRLHAVELRIPGAPRLGVGYVQAPGAPLRELEHVRAEETVAPDGLIASARLAIGPPALELEVEPLAFAPLRLGSPDGRVSHFPRAMCRLRCADGRAGLGWLEWNLNQPAAAT